MKHVTVEQTVHSTEELIELQRYAQMLGGRLADIKTDERGQIKVIIEFIRK